MKFKVLGIVQNLGALAQIRIISPLEYLKSKGLVEYQILDMSKNKPPKVKHIPDLVLQQRTDTFKFLNLIKLLKSKGSKVIYELDDNLLKVPKKNVAYPYYNNPHVRRALLENIWMSDHLIVTNDYLKNSYYKHKDEVSVIPNFIDTQIFRPFKEEKRLNNPLRIGYAGTMTHLEDFEQVTPALLKLKKKYEKEIKLVFINFIPPEFIEDPWVEFLPGDTKLEGFAKILSDANLDIGLAPLKFNEFNQSKSDIKFLEYGIEKIAGIYSDYSPYHSSVVDKENGLFVKSESSDEWYEKITYLIENPSEIKKYQKNAFDYVLQNRTMEKNAYLWYETFEKVIHNKKTQVYVDKKIDKTNKPDSAGVSIVIVTYNSAKTVPALFTSLIKTIRKQDEVIFVDNASKDGTQKKIAKLISGHDQFKLIKNKHNEGFSAGCNIGIKNSNNDFIVLLNPDTIVEGNWLGKMLFAFEDERVAAVGPLSNYVAGYQNVSLYLDNSKLQQNTSANEINKILEKKYSKEFSETKLLIGFCMMIKREVLNKLGLLDENLFLGNDDLELSWRFRINDYKIVIAKDTFVYHEGQKSFKTVDKSVTDKLVQESTDALYEKLKNYYGEYNVPTPQELWGINWFTPTNAKFKTDKKLNENDLPVASIVIPVYNQWEYTKQAIESIEQFTGVNYEIIVVDNASTDGTAGKLKTYKNIKVITNEKNLGFPKAVNQGILESKGKYVVLLNNDTVVTENWLDKMIKAAESDSNIGIVGPVSNFVSGVQLDKNAKYSNLKEMHLYAKELSEKNNGEIQEFPRVAFLCTLIKREVIDKIGGLDERFSPGNFEDDDFCLRAQLAGFKTVIAKDVFIHHFGSVSFKKEGNEQYAERLEVNKNKFTEKWGADPEGLWLKGDRPRNRNLRYPINKDRFVQYFERTYVNIDDNEITLAIENLMSAIENFNSSEKRNYENVKQDELFILLGNLFVAQSDLENAREAFEQALNFNPTSSAACAGLGEIFYLSGMYEEAKVMYEWAVVNDRNNSKAAGMLKEINLKLNLPEEHNSVVLETQTSERAQT